MLIRMQPTNTVLLTGDGNPHAFSATSIKVKWVQFVAESIASTSAPARVGGTNVTSAIGAPLFVQGASQFFPESAADVWDYYDLSEMKYFLATNDTGSLMYGI